MGGLAVLLDGTLLGAMNMEGVRVLLVDDEVEFVEALGERLTSRGFVTAVAFSGDAALDRISREDFDVVLLDLFMPGRNGLATLREIKLDSPLTEVIMLSGKGTEDTAIEGMKFGAFDFLVKPPNIDDIVDKLEDAYAKRTEHVARIEKAQAVGLDTTAEDLVPGADAAGEGSHDGRLVVLGHESEFSERLIEYALEMAKRLSYGIVAVNAAGFSEESFRSFPAARKRVWRDFQTVSEKNAVGFRRAAAQEGIPFSHVVKFPGQDAAIQEVQQEMGEVDFVVSEPEDDLTDSDTKPRILVYSPV